MTVDIDRLLKQDMLSFTPVTGDFDVEQLAEQIARIDYSFRDEAQPERFVVAPSAEIRDAIAAARRADPDSPFPMMLNIEAHAYEVMIWPVTYKPELRELTRRVVEWMLASYRCTVENDMGVGFDVE